MTADQLCLRISNPLYAAELLQVVVDASPAPVDAAIKVGVLSLEELKATYAGASSVLYRPYISDPYTTLHLVTRSLFDRNPAFLGLSFFAGLLEDVVMNHAISLTVYFDKSRDWSQQQPAVLYWDVAAVVWRQVWDTCGGAAPVVDFAAGTVQVSLCSTVNAKDRVFGVDPGTPAMFSATTQFIVAAIDKQFVTTAPSLLPPLSLAVVEGDTLVHVLESKDKEFDIADVVLSAAVDRGTVSVTDNVLTYVPDCTMCRPHTVNVLLVVKERLQHEGPPLSSAVTTVRISVAPGNHPPTMLFVGPSGQLELVPASLVLTTAINTGQSIALPTVMAVDTNAVSLDASTTSGSLAWSGAARLASLKSSVLANFDPSLIGRTASDDLALDIAVLEGRFTPTVGLTGTVEVRVACRGCTAPSHKRGVCMLHPPLDCSPCFVNANCVLASSINRCRGPCAAVGALPCPRRPGRLLRRARARGYPHSALQQQRHMGGWQMRLSAQVARRHL